MYPLLRPANAHLCTSSFPTQRIAPIHLVILCFTELVDTLAHKLFRFHIYWCTIYCTVHIHTYIPCTYIHMYILFVCIYMYFYNRTLSSNSRSLSWSVCFTTLFCGKVFSLCFIFSTSIDAVKRGRRSVAQVSTNSIIGWQCGQEQWTTRKKKMRENWRGIIRVARDTTSSCRKFSAIVTGQSRSTR